MPPIAIILCVLYAHPPLAPPSPTSIAASHYISFPHFHRIKRRLERTAQVVENYQNEAQEEVKMAARDLEGIRAQRMSDRSGTVFVRQVRRNNAGNFPCIGQIMI